MKMNEIELRHKLNPLKKLEIILFGRLAED